MSTKTALEQGLAVCHICLALSPIEHDRCRRCHQALHSRLPHSIQRTAALILTALVLYVPANVLPIAVSTQLGRTEANTIVGGVVELWAEGSYPIALVILIASVLIPIGKLAALAFLVYAAMKRKRGTAQRFRQTQKLYRIADFVGKWSMVDIFVVGLLVALIQLGGVMTVRPGPAALAFAGVVIATMLAVETFDPRLIWDRHGRPD